MPRISPVQNPDPKAENLLQGVEKALGVRPNLMTTLAHSPAALGAYLQFGQALGGSNIPASLREQIATSVAGANHCTYCASAHTLLGKNAGVADDELARNLRGQSDDPRTAAALSFATALVERRGWVGDDDLAAVRDAGFSDAEVVEIIATVAINTFTNYFNHVAQTDVDFPLVDAGQPATA